MAKKRSSNSNNVPGLHFLVRILIEFRRDRLSFINCSPVRNRSHHYINMGLHCIALDFWRCSSCERMELHSGFPWKNQSFAKTNRRVAKTMVSDHITHNNMIKLYDQYKASLNQSSLKLNFLLWKALAVGF